MRDYRSLTMYYYIFKEHISHPLTVGYGWCFRFHLHRYNPLASLYHKIHLQRRIVLTVIEHLIGNAIRILQRFYLMYAFPYHTYSFHFCLCMFSHVSKICAEYGFLHVSRFPCITLFCPAIAPLPAGYMCAKRVSACLCRTTGADSPYCGLTWQSRN